MTQAMRSFLDGGEYLSRWLTPSVQPISSLFGAVAVFQSTYRTSITSTRYDSWPAWTVVPSLRLIRASSSWMCPTMRPTKLWRAVFAWPRSFVERWTRTIPPPKTSTEYDGRDGGDEKALRGWCAWPKVSKSKSTLSQSKTKQMCVWIPVDRAFKKYSS